MYNVYNVHTHSRLLGVIGSDQSRPRNRRRPTSETWAACTERARVIIVYSIYIYIYICVYAYVYTYVYV